MAQLTYNNITKFRHLNRQDEEGPSKSVRERILQKFLRKHLQSDKLQMTDFLRNKEKFVSGSRQQSVASVTGGLSSLQCFKDVTQDLAVREMLSSCDLNSQEINCLLNDEHNISDNPQINNEMLEQIEKKLFHRLEDLSKKEEETFSDAIALSRRDYEDECKYFATNEVEKLTSCLVKRAPPSEDNLHPDHPMNHIRKIADNLFNNSKTSLENDKRTKTAVIKRSFDKSNADSLLLSSKKVKACYLEAKPKTYWDMTEMPAIRTNSEISLANVLNKEGDVQTIQVMNSDSNNENNKSNKTDFTKPFLWVLDPSQWTSLEEIKKNKVDIQTIRKDPKFSNYDIGKPSGCLFLKNLPRKVDPICVVKLFSRFEDANKRKIEYRILGGKMKGQAFVNFCNVATSQLALETCNGYLLNGKPIVMEFSKKA